MFQKTASNLTTSSYCKLFSILCLAFLISCSSDKSAEHSSDSVVNNPTYGPWQEKEESPLKFEQTLTIGNQTDLLFPATYEIEGPVTDSDGNIYFIDGKNGKLYSFDSQGNKRWETGNTGKGPGDFQDPNGLVTDGQYLYTANVQGARIDKFNLQGDLLNSTSLEKFDLSFVNVNGFISDSLLVTGSTLWGNIGRKITIFNTSGTLKKVSQFDVFSSSQIDVPKGFASSIDIAVVDTLITTGNNADYNIGFYDTKGNKVKTVTRDFNQLMRPGFYDSGSGRTMRGYGSLSAPTDFKNGYYVTTLSWPTNVDDPDQFLKRSSQSEGNSVEVIYKNAIDLYDAAGILLYSIETDGSNADIGTISYVDANGDVYTKSNTPFPQIRKYKIDFAASINVSEDAEQ